jgi:hypothetical protein
VSELEFRLKGKGRQVLKVISKRTREEAGKKQVVKKEKEVSG